MSVESLGIWPETVGEFDRWRQSGIGDGPQFTLERPGNNYEAGNQED